MLQPHVTRIDLIGGEKRKSNLPRTVLETGPQAILYLT